MRCGKESYAHRVLLIKSGKATYECMWINDLNSFILVVGTKRNLTDCGVSYCR